MATRIAAFPFPSGPWHAMQFTLKNSPATCSFAAIAGDGAVEGVRADGGVEAGATAGGIADRDTGAALGVGLVRARSNSGETAGDAVAGGEGAAGAVEPSATTAVVADGAGVWVGAGVADATTCFPRLERPHEGDHLFRVGLGQRELIFHRQHELAFPVQHGMYHFGVAVAGLPFGVGEIRNQGHGLADDRAPPIRFVARNADRSIQLVRGHPDSGRRRCRCWGGRRRRFRNRKRCPASGPPPPLRLSGPPLLRAFGVATANAGVGGAAGAGAGRPPSATIRSIARSMGIRTVLVAGLTGP